MKVIFFILTLPFQVVWCFVKDVYYTFNRPEVDMSDNLMFNYHECSSQYAG